MRKKIKGYLVTYEKGEQKTFKTIYDIQLALELTHNDIVRVLKNDTYTFDNVTHEKVWIEELA